MSMPQGGAGQPWETNPQGGAPGQWQGAAGQGAGQGSPPGGTPGGYAESTGVSEMSTRVTGRRFFQYIIDVIISGVVGGLISWALDRGTGGVHAFLYFVLIVVDIFWYFIYWALVPYRMNGQTLGMRVLGLRILDRSGSPASLMQLFIRSILLVLFNLLAVIVGFITMMFSKYRQRVGDHIAKTVVVRAGSEPQSARQEYAGAGQAGTQ